MDSGDVGLCFLDYGDPSREQSIVGKLQGENTRFGKVGADDKAAFLIEADLTEALGHGLEAGVWPHAV